MPGQWHSILRAYGRHRLMPWEGQYLPRGGVYSGRHLVARIGNFDYRRFFAWAS